MEFNRHPYAEGSHAFLSASKYHWLRYDEDKMIENFRNSQATALGTRKHEFAAEAIKLKQKLANSKMTMNMYINDAISFRMLPEQVLFFSHNAFGTADAISFREDRKTGRMLLRIHDLKTGVSKASFDQLIIYVAFFCLEYGMLPGEIDIELRIYQNDDIAYMGTIENPDGNELDLGDVVRAMGLIQRYDILIDQMREEAKL
jgi:hypothetical protein